MQRSEGKLKSLTLKEKLKLIDIVESGRSVKDVSEEFSINRNTLHFILKNRKKIRDGIKATPGITGYKRIKQTKSPELEKRILAYMHDSRDHNQKLSGNIIKAVALEIAMEIGVDGFAASNGWLFSFFRRNNILMSEFNKGIDQHAQNTEETTPISYGTPEETFSSTVEPDDFYEMIQEDDSETDSPEAKQLKSEVTTEEYQPIQLTKVSADSSDKIEALDTTDEFPQNEQDTIEDANYLEYLYEETSWRSWCQMCASSETLSEANFNHLKIVKDLLKINSAVEDMRICENCSVAIEEIAKMIKIGGVVDAMFASLRKREVSESLPNKELNKIRLEYGFEEVDFRLEESNEIHLDDEVSVTESTHRNEVEMEYLNDENEYFEDQELHDDQSRLADVDYEADSPSTLDNFELGHEEHIEYETVDDSIVVNDQETSKRLQLEESFVYECHFCHEVFDKMCFLSNHTRTVHHSLPKVACSCGRFLSTWDSLMAHKRRHSPNENSFSCDLCSDSFRTKTGLSIHIKFKHEKPPKTYICNICNREFKESSVLKSHMRTHLDDKEKYSCECQICGRKVVNKYSLKYHINTIHKGEKHHFCQICGRGFGNKSNLRSHLISHSTENVSCEICGNVFKNRISLQSHRKIHKSPSERKFPCSYCDKTFHNRNHLQRHMIAHSDERLHKCTFPGCTNEYKWLKDLKNHTIGVHSDLRPYKCPFCDRTFVDAANERKHKLKDHPKELEQYESQYGKRGKRIIAETLEITFETDENVE